ncbi:c6 zinc finger [Trichoderma cornu-damae]|uniref:C6 zinc finger n=1 Tax=Trichoderma cornu-damae TaxID=654480 RepID=A0A9P8QWQ1_9HYPO|nr:c6 zinc finger [Trichoderma cornu-damae]
MDSASQQPQQDATKAPVPTAVVAKKRRRPPLSCEQCRKRKIRCDRMQPCTNCVKSNIPSCTYAPFHIPAWRAKKSDSAVTRNRDSAADGNARPPLRDIKAARPRPEDTQGPGAVEPIHPSLPFASIGSVGAPSPTALSSVAGPSSSSSSPNVDWLVARVHQLEEKLANALRINDAPDPLKRRQSAPETAEPVDGFVAKSRYYAHSHWIYGLSSVRLTVGHDLAGQDKINQGELYSSLGRCKALGRKIKKNRLKHFPSTDLGTKVPNRELADELVENYLRSFEGIFRVVHVPTFRADYAGFWEKGHLSDESFVILLQLVMALGAALYDDFFSLRPMATQWIFEAQMWLMMPPEKKRINIQGIQIQCLLLLAKSTCNVGLDLVWMMAGNLVRNAMFVGLHRDPRHLGDMTVYRAEMRRRLWATVLELNTQFSLEAGGSPLLSTAHYDTLPPANLNDEELTDEKDSDRKAVNGPKAPTQTSVSRALLATIPLRMNLINHVNNARPGDHYEETLRLNSDLTKSCRAISESLMYLKAAPNSPVTPFHILVAEGFLYRCFHALHQPIIVKHLDDARFYFSRQMCLDSAMKITHLWGFPDAWSDGPNAASEVMDADFKRLVTNGHGMFRNVASQATVVIQIELLHSKAGRVSSLGYLPTVGSANLQARLASTRAWKIERLRAGETNIKGVIFTAACLAQVEALEKGVDPQQTARMMFQAATDMSKRCFEILKEVAEREGLPKSEWDDETTSLDGSSVSGVSMEWMQEWAWADAQGISFPQWDPDFEGGYFMDDLGFDMDQFE